MTRPLEGVQVIDAGMLVQAPQAAALLADMGAQVIKVELPGFGDQARFIPLSAEDFRSAYFTACNRGKRSLTLDLRTEAGANIFKRLANTADVVVSNFKPGTMEAWGLGYEHLAATNPGIIWAAGSTFGPLGADAHREGADLAGQAAGGLISTTGRDGDPPTPVGVTIADHIGSLNMVAGILAALHVRHGTGRGQRVEVSLLGGQIWAQAAEYSHFLLTDQVPGRANYGHPLLPALYRIFPTADGWIGLIGMPPDTLDAFFTALGQPELALDERLRQTLPTPETMAWLAGIVEAAFKTQTTAHWCAALGEAGVRYAPVRDYREVAADQGAWQNGYFAEAQDTDGQTHRVVGTPIRMSATPLAPAATAPALGEHTDEILHEAGYAEAEIEAFRKAGVV